MSIHSPRCRSTLGRPRRLSDADIAAILAWHDARCTNAEKARELGISPSLLAHIIRTRGADYKQASPEAREHNRAALRSQRAQLAARGWL